MAVTVSINNLNARQAATVQFAMDYYNERFTAQGQSTVADINELAAWVLIHEWFPRMQLREAEVNLVESGYIDKFKEADQSTRQQIKDLLDQVS